MSDDFVQVAPAQVMECVEGFVTDFQGTRFVGVKGRTRVPANHPLVRQYPTFFRPIEPMAQYNVEEATAVPGQRRDRPSRKAAVATTPNLERG